MSNEMIQKNKAIVWEYWQKLNGADARSVGQVVRAYTDEGALLHLPHPINLLSGAQAQIEGFWQPLLNAFPGLKRRCDIFIGGHVHWVGAIGYFDGIFSHDWLGIPPTGEMLHIRFGEFSAVHNGKIVLTYLLIDILDVIRQAGFQLVPPSLGEEILVPGPMTGDGLIFTPQDEAEGAKTLAMAKTMCRALNTPKCAEFWDTERMAWYGPSGIGASYGYKAFEDNHQNPFDHAFPGYGAERMGLHIAEVGEGNYAGWVGWPSIRAYMSGAYLGFPPNGKMIEWRLMDFYRREGDLIIENWVPIDMGYVFLQLGLDVFAELRQQVAGRGQR
jgi:predicted ester cyclase